MAVEILPNFVSKPWGHVSAKMFPDGSAKKRTYRAERQFREPSLSYGCSYGFPILKESIKGKDDHFLFAIFQFRSGRHADWGNLVLCDDNDFPRLQTTRNRPATVRE